MSRRCLLSLAVGTALLGLAGCERTPANPAPPADGVKPPRVAVLSPALAATLDDLGLSTQIVGRHAWDLVLDPELPVVGDGLGEVDYERLALVKPDLVLGQFGAAGIPARLVDLAAKNGWTVRDHNPLSLSDVSVTARAMALDLEAAGLIGVLDRLSTIEGALDESLAPRSSAVKAGRVLLIAELAPLAALGPGSVHHDILLRLGATPALTSGAPYVTLDAEDLRKINPDALMIVTPRPRDSVSSTSPEVVPTIPGLTTTRVIVIDDPLTHLTATTIRRTAAQMGDALDTWVKP
jgi:ABC-type Fe3+-hydroxamate transport system substrate-binding protein